MPALTPYHVPGPVDVKWANGALGECKEGVVIKPRQGIRPITSDWYGTEPADYIITGRSLTVEFRGLDILQLKNSGVISGTGQEASENVGIKASDVAEELVINESAGAWIAERTYPIDIAELPLRSTEEIQFLIVFLVIPDANGKLFRTVPHYVR